MKLTVIGALFRKDFQDGLHNYQILLMVLSPIVLSLLFSNLFKESKERAMLPRVGVIASPQQPLLKQFTTESTGVRLVFCQTVSELETRILEGDIGFGLVLPTQMLITPSVKGNAKVSLFYPAEIPQYAVDRMQTNLERELRRFLSLPAPQLPIELEMKPVGGRNGIARSFSGDLFPMLVLMAMGMVGFLGVPLSFAEEKEKCTLHALFLTPASPAELIIGKSLFGFCLIGLTVLLMVLVNQRFEGDQVYFWLFTMIGACLCIFIGLLVSFFAPTQGAVNAIGTTLFMFFQIVPNLSNSSEILKTISPFVPSTFISRGLKKAMFLDLSKVDISADLAPSICMMLLSYLAVFLCFRYRQSNI